jgi:uncharacterized protein
MTRPRIILDTNILVSRAVYPSEMISTVVQLAFERCTPIVSQETFDELQRVLFRFIERKKFTTLEMDEVLATYLAVGAWVNIITHIELCRDPDDDKFLSLAINGEANYVVTGDKDLLVLKKIGRTKIITPKGFISLMENV